MPSRVYFITHCTNIMCQHQNVCDCSSSSSININISISVSISSGSGSGSGKETIFIPDSHCRGVSWILRWSTASTSEESFNLQTAIWYKHWIENNNIKRLPITERIHSFLGVPCAFYCLSVTLYVRFIVCL